jgi:hypothetical protein
MEVISGCSAMRAGSLVVSVRCMRSRGLSSAHAYSSGEPNRNEVTSGTSASSGAGLLEAQHAVGDHLGPQPQLPPRSQRGQRRVRDAADAELQRRPVGDEPATRSPIGASTSQADVVRAAPAALASIDQVDLLRRFWLVSPFVHGMWGDLRGRPAPVRPRLPTAAGSTLTAIPSVTRPPRGGRRGSRTRSGMQVRTNSRGTRVCSDRDVLQALAARHPRSARTGVSWTTPSRSGTPGCALSIHSR